MDLKKENIEFEAQHSDKVFKIVKFDQARNSYSLNDHLQSTEINLIALAEINYGWDLWQKAKAQAVPDGYVLVTEDQAKDTSRLDFMLQENKVVTTDINVDENYERTGEGFCVNAVYWIDGWDRLTETVHQTKREAIDEAINVASESGAEG